MIKFLLFAALLTGCTTLQTIDSHPKSNNSKINYTDADTVNNIDFSISNNEQSIFISFKTSDKFTITKIIHGGLKIYFDKELKQNTKCYFNYPVAYNTEKSINNIKNRNQDANNEFTLTREFAYILNEAYFFNNTKRKSYNSNAKDSEIKFKIGEIDDKILTYSIEVPFNMIYSEADSTINRDFLSVGVVTGELKMPSQSGQSRESQVFEDPGSMDDRQASMNRRPQRHSNQDIIKFETPLDLWAKVRLYKDK